MIFFEATDRPGFQWKNRSVTDLCHPKFGFRYTLVVPSLGRWWGMMGAGRLNDQSVYKFHVVNLIQCVGRACFQRGMGWVRVTTWIHFAKFFSYSPKEPALLYMTDPNGAAIYGVPWIPTKTPVMLAFFYQHQPDPRIRGWESDGFFCAIFEWVSFFCHEKSIKFPIKNPMKYRMNSI